MMFVGARDVGNYHMWSEVSRDPTAFATYSGTSPVGAGTLMTGTSVTYTRHSEEVYVANVDEFVEQRMGGSIPT